MRGGEVQHRRRHLADVDDIHAGGANTVDEARVQRRRRLTIVAPDRDGAAAVVADQRRVGAADLAEDLGVDVAAHAAAHVVGAKDVRIEHHRSQRSTSVTARRAAPA